LVSFKQQASADAVLVAGAASSCSSLAVGLDAWLPDCLSSTSASLHLPLINLLTVKPAMVGGFATRS
jgi:hypothetical protein